MQCVFGLDKGQYSLGLEVPIHQFCIKIEFFSCTVISSRVCTTRKLITCMKKLICDKSLYVNFIQFVFVTFSKNDE